jgi:hypothetical protein
LRGKKAGFDSQLGKAIFHRCHVSYGPRLVFIAHYRADFIENKRDTVSFFSGTYQQGGKK